MSANNIEPYACDELSCEVYCGINCPLYYPCVTCACQWYNQGGIIMNKG